MGGSDRGERMDGGGKESLRCSQACQWASLGPCMTRCLFVIYLYATSQSKKRKGKKLKLVLEIDVDKDVDVKSGPNRQCIGS